MIQDAMLCAGEMQDAAQHSIVPDGHPTSPFHVPRWLLRPGATDVRMAFLFSVSTIHMAGMIRDRISALPSDLSAWIRSQPARSRVLGRACRPRRAL